MLTARGARELAIADAQALVARHPQRSAADWFNLGFLLEEAGRYDEAIPAFRRAVELDPKLDRAWYGMGLAHARLGEHAAAAEAFARSVALQPMHGEAYYLWGMACHRAARPQQVEEVIGRLVDFDARLAARLVRDVGREEELGPLLPEMPF